MAQPTAYNRQYNFTNYQTSNPSDPLPGDENDSEFNAVKITLDQVLANLALIQRDDGNLANQSVGRDQFDSSIEIGFSAPEAWGAAEVYDQYATSFHGGVFYRATEAHTAGATFDQSKWEAIADLVGPGLRWAFDDSTTTTSDPGAGKFRLNNATLASVTEIAVSDTLSGSAASDVAALVATWDDSTSTVKGHLLLHHGGDPEIFAEFRVTGLTDDTGFTRLTVAHLASNGDFTGGHEFRAAFSRNGDAGDLTISGSVSDGELMLADGATGTLLEGAGVVPTTYAKTFLGGSVPAFAATKSGDQSSIGAQTNAKIVSWSEVYDHTNQFSTANSAFTPSAGIYLFEANLHVSGVQDGERLRAMVWKNGATHRTNYVVTVGTGNQNVYVTAVVSANGTDYFECYFHAGGTDFRTIVGSESWWSMTQLRAA